MRSRPCCSARSRRYCSICRAKLVELLDIARLGEFGQRLQVDHADLRRLRRLFELLQQPVDLFELLLDLQRLRDGGHGAAGELVLRGQFVDLILVAQPVDQLHELPGELAALVVGPIPEPLQVVKLLLARTLRR